MNQAGISGVASPKHYWKTILCILRFRIGLFSADSFAWIGVFLGVQIFSLANKYFFNLLEGKTSYPYFGFWPLISLIIIAQCWNIVWNFSGLTIGSYFFHQTRTLLIKNILLNIFNRPGAQVLKESSGDSIYLDLFANPIIIPKDSFRGIDIKVNIKERNFENKRNV